MKFRFLSSPLYNLELSKSPQSSSICNHNLARGDLLDSRLSGQAIYVLGPLQIDGSDQVHLDHEPELVPRVEESTPSLIVYLDPQLVARDPRGGDADGRSPVLARLSGRRSASGNTSSAV
jgi:hypothetical protein